MYFLYTNNKVISTYQLAYDKLVHVVHARHMIGHFKCFQTLARASTINKKPQLVKMA